MKRELFKKYFKIILVILLGGAIGGLSFNLFILPNQLLSGGVSGISLIISYMTGINPGILVAILNIPIFIIGYKFVDKEFIVLSLIGMISFSFFLDAFAFLQGAIMLEDMMLACIFGGILNGVGMGIVFRSRASQGGIDIFSVIIKKYYSMNIGATSLMINVIIVTVSIFIFKDIARAMYTLITMFVSSMVLDRVQDGFDIRKSVMIICNKEEEVGRAIIEKLHRGVTYMEGEGAYSGAKKKVIYCIVAFNQLAKLKQVVTEIDPKAFMAVSDIAEVSGRGFSKKGI